MIAAILLASQASTFTLPAGVSPEFSAKVFSIQKHLQAGEWDAATAELAKMPTANVSITWNDSAVPEARRAAFVKSRDLAIASWKAFFPALNVTVAEQGTVNVRFAEVTEAKNAEGSPLGMQLKLERPSADVLIGMFRGAQRGETTDMNVHNDLVRAIGAYLGVGASPIMGTGLYPYDYPMPQRAALMRQDSNAAIENLRVLDALRAAAAAKQSISAQQPKATVGGDLDIGNMFQGETKRMGLTLANEGTAPLQLWAKPDCGCTTLEAVQSLAPGEKRTIAVNFDSKEFDGEIGKRIVFVTNDPVEPVRVVLVKGHVRPMYRFLMPSGPVAITDENGGTAEVFLTFKDAEPFAIKKLDVLGLNADVTYAPWSGTLADPQKGEGAIARKGYKFLIKMPKNLPPGRSPVALSLLTDSTVNPRIQYIVQVQKGIIALPDELYLGELTDAKKAKLIVSRPGRAFQIKSITSESSNFTAEVVKGDQGEYELVVNYDGKAPKGELNTALIVTTDDPKQPTVRVPVVATIR